MAPLVLLSAVRVKLVIAIESPSAETALRVPLESALINRSRVIIAELLVLLQLLLREELMLMCKDLLVPRAKITHNSLMHTPHMPVQVRPAHACDIASGLRTIVPQQQKRILKNLRLFVCDPKIVVLLEKVRLLVFLISLLALVREYDRRCLRSAVCARLGLVQCPQSQRADVACAVVARCHAAVRDVVGADEANLFVILVHRMARLALRVAA